VLAQRAARLQKLTIMLLAVVAAASLGNLAIWLWLHVHL
jgi:hypothetical protein